MDVAVAGDTGGSGGKRPDPVRDVVGDPGACGSGALRGSFGCFAFGL
jgi:hypothetical protein